MTSKYYIASPFTSSNICTLASLQRINHLNQIQYWNHHHCQYLMIFMHELSLEFALIFPCKLSNWLAQANKEFEVIISKYHIMIPFYWLEHLYLGLTFNTCVHFKTHLSLSLASTILVAWDMLALVPLNA